MAKKTVRDRKGNGRDIIRAGTTPGSGPMGQDSRPGAFRAALAEVRAITPSTREGVLRLNNRKVGDE